MSTSLRTLVTAPNLFRLGAVFYLAVLAIFLADGFTNFDIDSRALKSFVYSVPFLGAIPLAVLAMLTQDRRVRWTLLPATALALLVLFVVGPMVVVFSRSSWVCFGVMAVDRANESRTIERQYIDVGALGYEERTVVAYRPFPLVMWCTPFDGAIDPGVWREVTAEESLKLGLP